MDQNYMKLLQKIMQYFYFSKLNKKHHTESKSQTKYQDKYHAAYSHRLTPKKVILK